MVIEAGTKVVKGKSVNFILTPQRIYFQTHLQSNYLLPAEAYWLRHVRYIRALIEMGVIKDLGTLAEHCSYKLKWVPSKTRFEI